ncbi:MAG: hypothetical protein WAW17_12405, partial [Rhodococcus sp. (in: high G+C Gram-positive bacteria)]
TVIAGHLISGIASLPVSGFVSGFVSLPARCVHAGTRAVTVGAAITVNTTLIGAETVAGVGTALLRAPTEVAAAAPSPSDLFRTLAGIARESVGGEPARRWGFGENRTWIEPHISQSSPGLSSTTTRCDRTAVAHGVATPDSRHRWPPSRAWAACTVTA